VRVLVPLLIAAIATASCGGDSGAPPAGGSPPATGPDIPISGSPRLAWSQRAPTLDVARSYTFLLYVDGARTPLSGASCAAAGDGFECSAPLPALTSGRHVLELSTQDPGSGLESARSAPLGVTRNAQRSGNGGQLTSQSPPRGDPSLPAIIGCIEGPSGICFSTTVIADNLGPVERMVALPDERLLVLFAGGIVRILPNGAPDRLDLGRFQEPVDVADIAVDPEFQTNRYVYLAVVGTDADGRRTAAVVRMRELADRLGEAATLAVDLPAGAGRPAVSVGPDLLLYIAIPSSDRQSNAGGPYEGLVLRLTRDGRAAGQERLASPVFSTGRARPAAFAWLDREHLLLGASDGFGVVRVGAAQGGWPVSMATLPLSSINGPETLETVARGADAAASLFVLGSAPRLLYVARVITGERTEIRSMDPIPLGRFVPGALAVGGNGDPMVAGSDEPGAPVRVLRLRFR
jgi:hypothetical protein